MQSSAQRAEVEQCGRRTQPLASRYWNITHTAAGRKAAPNSTTVPDLDELLGVEGAMPVAAATDGLGQHHAGGVDGLPDVGQVHAAGDLLDQHGRQALGAVLQASRSASHEYIPCTHQRICANRCTRRDERCQWMHQLLLFTLSTTIYCVQLTTIHASRYTNIRKSTRTE